MTNIKVDYCFLRKHSYLPASPPQNGEFFFILDRKSCCSPFIHSSACMTNLDLLHLTEKGALPQVGIKSEWSVLEHEEWLLGTGWASSDFRRSECGQEAIWSVWDALTFHCWSEGNPSISHNNAWLVVWVNMAFSMHECYISCLHSISCHLNWC